jgi:hypothetical protein
MTLTAHRAKSSARNAEGSTPVDRLARFGLVCRGLVWLVVGGLAVDVALGGHARADRQGALEVIRDQPLGGPLLALLGAGFAGYAAWRLLQAVVGHRDADGAKRWLKRTASLARGGLYGGLAVSTVKFLLAGPEGDSTAPLTARVMRHSGGQLLIGVVGIGLILGGLVMAVRGAKQDFDDKLKPVPRDLRGVVKVVGTAGLVGRGLVFALIGGFLLEAAVSFDPAKAKGLDAALKSLAHEPYGRGLIGLAAAGLVAFALWSFAEARWRKV